MELTPFGKEVRKLRIEFDLLLKDMAAGLDVSPSWLSALETGRKNVPEGLVRKIANLLGLSEERRARLADAALRSRERFSLRPGNDPLRRDVAAALARRFDEFDESDLRALQDVVRRKPQ